MSHISKPVDWEVYNIPPVQPVQYYSILKKKREVIQKQYDTQVFKQGYLHYCGIVPKNISSSLNYKHEIIIVFFNEIPNTSFIGFRVKVSKETFVQESNSLLLFLKKSKKAGFYRMSNNYIHVQCGTNAWELFYRVYANYLKKYVLTFIGTQFFYHFVYSKCIQKEKQLIDMLYKGSKVIKVSRKSIYYEIHRKRKISIADLIHMTLNMPKSKRYVISSFSSKEKLLYSNMNDGNFYTPAGTKINVSKLMLKRFKKHSQNILPDAATKSVDFQKMFASSSSAFSFPPEHLASKCSSNKQISSSSTVLKRKFSELNSNENIEPGPSTSKFYKSSELTSINEDQWEQYRNFKPYNLKTYSSIPCLSNLVPNLLKNGESSHFVHETSYLFNSDTIFPLPSTSSSKEETSKVTDDINSCKLTVNGNENKTVQVKNEALHLVNHSNNLDTLDPAYKKICFPEIQKRDESNQSHLHETFSGQDSYTLDISSGNTKNCFSSLKDTGFNTAAGRTIKISESAMLAAHKFIQEFNEANQENLQESSNCDPNKVSRIPSLNNNYPRKISMTGYKTHTKIPENKPFHDIKFLKNEKESSKKIDAMEDVAFSTAAGKTISVSDTALELAHKLVQDEFNKDTIPTSSKNICLDVPKNKMYKHKSAIFKNVDCSSKETVDENIVDIDMDNTLVEKFFEDTIFEEELESASICKKNDNSDLPSKIEKNIPLQRPRKSLGGRRSTRYSSNKL